MKTDSTVFKELCLQEKISFDDRLLKAIDASSVSGELNVASTSLTVQTCEVLSKLVSLSETITKIDVSDCLLAPQALAVLLNPVKLSKIHTLQLKGNNIMGPSVYRVAALVSRSHNLKVLVMEPHRTSRRSVSVDSITDKQNTDEAEITRELHSK